MFLGLFCQALLCLSSSECGSSYNQSPHSVPSSHSEFLPGQESFQEAKILAALVRQAERITSFLFFQVR